MPEIECLVTLNEQLLMVRRAGALAPIRGEVESGESALETCARAVQHASGFRIAPSLAGVFYEAKDDPADYTLVFVADAPNAATLRDGLEWVDLQSLHDATDVRALQREVIPLLLTADSPLAVLVEKQPADGEVHVRESAPIDPARLSPLVFAVKP